MSGAASCEPRHLPVLPREVVHFLAPHPGCIFVDATAGAGGHALLLAAALDPTGRLIGIDQDAAMLDLARHRLADASGPAITLIQSNFDRLPEILRELSVAALDGVLADLGFCSDQLDDPARGLSFVHDGPLDMRFDRSGGPTAADLLRRWDERELADVFWRYGEERFSRRIARKIVDRRRRQPLDTTTQLAELVHGCVPRGRGHRIDPATRVFQALRIAVNDELGALERLLAALPSVLKPGGRAVIISFHSLEDRLVKQAFRDREVYELLTRKPARAGADEVRSNPRARSAKLRAVVRKQ